MNLQFTLVSLLNTWQEPKGKRKTFAVCFVILMLAIAGGIVYFTGGLKYAYAHIIYIPILLAAILFKTFGGIGAAVAAGLILGPLMPVDTGTGERQILLNWLIRLALFTLTGTLFGTTIHILHDLRQKECKAAYHDPFTHLPNQNSLQRSLENMIRENKYAQIKLLIINIDNYIELFYTFGAIPCNVLLSQIYHQLIKILPPDTKIYQIQTNKFCVLLSDNLNHLDVLPSVYESFSKSLFSVDGIPMYIEISTGIANYPEHALTAEDLIQKAGIALYAAKKNLECYSCYDDHNDWTSKKQVELIGNIPNAIVENQFILHYQPKYNLEENQICGIEALARWQHPKHGLLFPDLFLPGIEKTALIDTFTKWVIATALSQLRQWHDMGFYIQVSVNISAKNLKDTDFIRFIDNQLRTVKISPSYLELEITESAVMENQENAVLILSKLRELGVRIAVDDFGTGLTSLAYLKYLPVDIIKIDRSFITNLSTDTRDFTFVSAIIAMAKSLNMEIIAEGVEDRESIIILQNMGCSCIQGFYCAKPAPWDEISSLLKEKISPIHTR